MYPRNNRPLWIISSWGTELNFGIEYKSKKNKLIKCIQQCDWFISDCFRDIFHARSLGLPETKLPWNHPVPGTGGIDQQKYGELRKTIQERKLIVIPKAYENQSNKTLPILEALRLCEDILDNYEIKLLMCSPEVISYVKRLPPKISEKCTCLSNIPHEEVMSMLGQARVMFAPSISDGTPNVMLEAMDMGALPIMSPISSIQEWIIDGDNGLLAHALYPDQLSIALRKALTDDTLFLSAAQKNQKIIFERANRDIIRNEVINFYKSISTRFGY